MPHITIECSANLETGHDVQALVDAVHAAALATGVPAADALRTRAEVRRYFRVADGDPVNAFVAVTVRLAPGRSETDLNALLHAVMDTTVEHVRAGAHGLDVAFSAELQELDPVRRINRNDIRARMQGRGD